MHRISIGYPQLVNRIIGTYTQVSVPSCAQSVILGTLTVISGTLSVALSTPSVI